jgi:hypothetical protein
MHHRRSEVRVSALAFLASTVGDVTERMRTRWHLRYHAPLDDDSLEGDLVYVSGTVRALDETLVAPLSGRSCVAYRSRARANITMGVSHETMQVRPFAIERDDGEGTIIAFSEVADFCVPVKRPRDPVRIRSFLARHAIPNGTLSEVLVEIGARVHVGGTLVLIPHDEPPTGELGFRDPPPPDPHLAGNRDVPLVIVTRER